MKKKKKEKKYTRPPAFLELHQHPPRGKKFGWGGTGECHLNVLSQETCMDQHGQPPARTETESQRKSNRSRHKFTIPRFGT